MLCDDAMGTKTLQKVACCSNYSSYADFCTSLNHAWATRGLVTHTGNTDQLFSAINGSSVSSLGTFQVHEEPPVSGQGSRTPRRCLTLTPELNSPVSRRKRRRKLTAPKSTPDLDLRGASEKDEGSQVDKENNDTLRKVRLRLFGPSSPDDSVNRDKTQYRQSPVDGATTELDPKSVALFQRLRNRKRESNPHMLYNGKINPYLIGDFSKYYVLPVEKVAHQDLHCVSAQTVASLIGGQFASIVRDFLIVDCRYPYEYSGGHIKGAVNLYTETQIKWAFLRVSCSDQMESPSAKAEKPSSPGEKDEGSSPRKLIVFHCEFSTQRGPHLCQYLRKLDRDLHTQAYPHLIYPELYLLQGGYKFFHSCYPELCEPPGYIPMRHMNFRQQFLDFNRKRRLARAHFLWPVRNCGGSSSMADD